MTRVPEPASVLRQIRSLQVIVIHPQDQDGDELSAQLHRIGCNVQTYWPELKVLPPEAGLILLAVRPETLGMEYPWIGQPTTPPVIPVVTYESPITIEAVLRLNAFTTIASPVRSFGLLTAIAVALMQHKARNMREHYIQRLERKSAKQRVVQQAKQIMMDARGVSEEEAYSLLRAQSMLKRANIEDIAHNIVEAHKTLGF
ncbi:MAG: antitermination protein [Thiomonas sp. 13-66-29]|jgi:AmiR/NasT family two-component response regulator|nr:MAG: antitermination protein [Thiomonas sp. 13-66-29]